MSKNNKILLACLGFGFAFGLPLGIFLGIYLKNAIVGFISGPVIGILIGYVVFRMYITNNLEWIFLLYIFTLSASLS